MGNDFNSLKFSKLIWDVFCKLNIKELKKAVDNIKKYTELPIIAGFGINNKDQVNKICKITDGVVVGSSIVKIIENNLKNEVRMINNIGKFVKDLNKGSVV